MSLVENMGRRRRVAPGSPRGKAVSILPSIPPAEERGGRGRVRSSDAPGGPGAFTALGSSVRLRILDALSRGERTVAELARDIHLHRVTLHYHLSRLLQEGLVEEVQPQASGRAGRPAARFRASPHAVVPGFPPRRFNLLAKLALETLSESLGGDRALEALRRKGMEVGRGLIAQLEAREKVGAWTPESFERVVLQGAFQEDGAAIEVVGRSPRELVYRAFTCPFLELAQTSPEAICDALDLGFHAGVDRALGNVRSERVSCIGHGAPYCEYRMTWGSAGGTRR